MTLLLILIYFTPFCNVSTADYEQLITLLNKVTAVEKAIQIAP